MKKPIVFIYTYSEKIDNSAKALLDAGFDVALPYNCAWAFKNTIKIPKEEIDKRGVIRGGLKYLHDVFSEPDVILAEEYVAAEDVLLVYSTMLESPDALVLSERENPSGTGRFEKIAYKIIRTLFAVVQGRMVHDMHSGVRGIPGQYLSVFYDMHGSDRDFLLGQIMTLRRLNIPLVQCQAITQGISSAAHTIGELVKDILKVALLFLMFVSSSLFSTAVDFGIYALMLNLFTESLFVASATGRAISSIINFTINQSVVFKQKNPQSKWRMITKYYLLVISLWTFDYLALVLFVHVLGVNRMLAKLIVGALIYAVSFIFQRDFVFKHKK